MKTLKIGLKHRSNPLLFVGCTDEEIAGVVASWRTGTSRTLDIPGDSNWYFNRASIDYLTVEGS